VLTFKIQRWKLSLLVGTILCVVGISLFATAYHVPFHQFYPKDGIAAFSSFKIDRIQNSIMNFEDVDVAHSIVNVSLSYRFKPPAGSFIFGAQIPARVMDIGFSAVVYNSSWIQNDWIWLSSELTASTFYSSQDDVTLLWLEPNLNSTHYEIMQIGFYFLWEGSVSQLDFSEYSLILPLSSIPEYAIYYFPPGPFATTKEILIKSILTSYDINSLIVWVALPPSGVVTSAFPEPDAFIPQSSSLLLVWNQTRISESKPLQTSISVTFRMPALGLQRDATVSLAGITLGLGLASIVQCLELFARPGGRPRSITKRQPKSSELH
jgi:hypothetical protein